MKRSMFVGTLLVCLAVFLSGCSAGNKYMIKNTAEWQQVTSKFEGNWDFTEFMDGSNNRLQPPFESAKISFDFNNRKSTMQLKVAKSYVEQKLVEWRAKWPDIKVDDYVVIVNNSWQVDSAGNIVLLQDKKPDIQIKGSGANFEAFFGWEKSRYVVASNAGSGGGLAGLAMSLAAKTVTNTSELIPFVPEKYEFKFENANTLRMESSFAIPKTTYRLIRSN